MTKGLQLSACQVDRKTCFFSFALKSADFSLFLFVYLTNSQIKDFPHFASVCCEVQVLIKDKYSHPTTLNIYFYGVKIHIDFCILKMFFGCGNALKFTYYFVKQPLAVRVTADYPRGLTLQSVEIDLCAIM